MRLLPLLPPGSKRGQTDSEVCDDAFVQLLSTHGFDVEDVAFEGKRRQVKMAPLLHEWRPVSVVVVCTLGACCY